MKKPTIAGTGLLALDVVIADNRQTDPILCAGGTCGNVLTSLAFLNWNSYPIARLRADAASKRVTEDLARWGVKLDFVTLDDDGSTPIVVQRIRQNKAGNPSHSFSRKCPHCGDWLPWYKAVRAADASQIASRLPDSDVFYFDRTSRGAISLAQAAYEKGSLVVFEPSAASDPAMLSEALAISHIVKIASDRLTGNKGIFNSREPLLLIETLGAAGLRFKRQPAKGRSSWKTLPAMKGGEVVDTAGAGDWCTAGIISKLGSLGVAGLKECDVSVVRSSIEFGQALAAWSCCFHGARGGMYELSKSRIIKAVDGILDGDLVPRGRKPSRQHDNTSSQAVWCDCCLSESVG